MKTLAVLCLIGTVSGCSQAQVNTALATPQGQLFCAVQTGGGGAVVVALVDASASAVAPAAAPVAVIATGATKAVVDADCAAAGGIAVSPPANPAAAPKLAVVVTATP